MVWYTVGMTKIQDLIDQINNAERLGLSTGEVTSAKKELQLVFAGLAFDVDQALRFEPFEDEVDEFDPIEREEALDQLDPFRHEVDEFIDLEA